MSKATKTPSRRLQQVAKAELARTEGGVMPVYGPNGEVITCTDPRRTGGIKFPKFPTLRRF